jgi:hypothetical protein
MITLPLPDKYIRKALYDLVNGIVVNTKTINIYDTHITGSTIPQHYILMTTQTNQVSESVKCGDRYESSILLDIVTRFNGSGNVGSRLLADDITEAVRNLLETKLSLGSGLNVVTQKLDFPNDLTSVTDNESIFRKFIRIELTIN